MSTTCRTLFNLCPCDNVAVHGPAKSLADHGDTSPILNLEVYPFLLFCDCAAVEKELHHHCHTQEGISHEILNTVLLSHCPPPAYPAG
jgi:hypothetical protein